MDSDYSGSRFNVPSFARQESYDFEAAKESSDIYLELNKIAEEIEKCRLRNT